MPTRLPSPPSSPLASATSATNASTIAPTATASLTPVCAPCGRGHDDVGRLLAFLERLGHLDLVVLDRVGVARVVGHDHLGHQDAARRRHEGRGEQVGQIALAEQAGVGGEDGPGDAGHADAPSP